MLRSAVVSSRQLLVHGELVGGLKNIWVVAGAEDVSLLSLPRGLVDSINPVLNLHDHASILLHNSGVASLVEETLSLLDSSGSFIDMLDSFAKAIRWTSLQFCPGQE